MGGAVSLKAGIQTWEWTNLENVINSRTEWSAAFKGAKRLVEPKGPVWNEETMKAYYHEWKGEDKDKGKEKETGQREA